MKFNKPPVEGEIVGDYGAIFIEQTQWRYQPCGRRNRYGLFKCGYCGNIFEANIAEVRRNKTRSCWCYRKIEHKERAEKKYKNKKFGMLTPLYQTDKQGKDGSYYWVCQCDCGNTTTISSADFTKTKSCGCLLFHSFGEQATKEILEENNVEYISQYSFDDCNSDFNAPLRFDFYLPKGNCCIEIDGRQHFTPVSRFGGEKAFERLQKNDKIKNNYCVKNNIKMIRIKYNRELNIKEIIYKTLVKNGVINE